MHRGHPSDVPPGPRQASGHPGRDRIDGGPNTIGIVTGQRGRHVGELRRTLRQAELDDDVLPFDVAQFAQSLPESGIGTSATSWSLRGDDRVYL